jgi:3-dehydro-L-gulonate 2-dehydrogenase
VYGGYTKSGDLTVSPAEVLESGRTLSIGYWKGAGLSLLLDVIGAVLSGGKAVHQITAQGAEKGLSQVFVAIDTAQLSNYRGIDKCLQDIVDDYKSSVGPKEIRFPGERVLRTRNENKKNGIPVLLSIWEEIIRLQ